MTTPAIQAAIREMQHVDKVKLLRWMETEIRHECSLRECAECNECVTIPAAAPAPVMGFGNI